MHRRNGKRHGSCEYIGDYRDWIGSFPKLWYLFGGHQIRAVAFWVHIGIPLVRGNYHVLLAALLVCNSLILRYAYLHAYSTELTGPAWFHSNSFFKQMLGEQVGPPQQQS